MTDQKEKVQVYYEGTDQGLHLIWVDKGMHPRESRAPREAAVAGAQAGEEECSGERRTQEVFEGASGGQHGERATLEELSKVHRVRESWARRGSRQFGRNCIMEHRVSI